MHLYLMRHGIAFEPNEWCATDALRPLTREGHERTREVCERLAKKETLKLDAMWSSPNTRAWQTAEIAQDSFGGTLTAYGELACGADLETLVRLAKTLDLPERLMLVGHEPDMGYILGELVGGGSRPFKKAGVAYAKGEFKPGGMKLAWQYAPRELLD